jgi:hypothetical protein
MGVAVDEPTTMKSQNYFSSTHSILKHVQTFICHKHIDTNEDDAN